MVTLKECKDEIDYLHEGWKRAYNEVSIPISKEDSKNNIHQIKSFISIHMTGAYYVYKFKIFEKIAGERFMLNNPKYFKYDKKRK